MTNKIDVKEFLDGIDTANMDGLFKVSKNGAYVTMTYNQIMEDVFKGRTELTMKRCT
jgi:pectate lyase